MTYLALFTSRRKGQSDPVVSPVSRSAEKRSAFRRRKQPPQGPSPDRWENMLQSSAPHARPPLATCRPQRRYGVAPKSSTMSEAAIALHRAALSLRRHDVRQANARTTALRPAATNRPTRRHPKAPAVAPERRLASFVQKCSTQ
jgi:hypothetical protein